MTKSVFNTEKKGQFLKKAALDNGDNESLSIFREDFTSARDRDNFIFDVKLGILPYKKIDKRNV